MSGHTGHYKGATTEQLSKMLLAAGNVLVKSYKVVLQDGTTISCDTESASGMVECVEKPKRTYALIMSEMPDGKVRRFKTNVLAASLAEAIDKTEGNKSLVGQGEVRAIAAWERTECAVTLK